MLAELSRRADGDDGADQMVLCCALQLGGDWTSALQAAGTSSRTLLAPTHFLYAQHLEALGDHEAAISQYERAGCHRCHSAPKDATMQIAM